jgi:UDP-glucuronate decarboxylase
LPSDDPVRRQPDIALARAVVQWSPSTGLDEGLRKAIEYFQAGAHAEQGAC